MTSLPTLGLRAQLNSWWCLTRTCPIYCMVPTSELGPHTQHTNLWAHLFVAHPSAQANPICATKQHVLGWFAAAAIHQHMHSNNTVDLRLAFQSVAPRRTCSHQVTVNNADNARAAKVHYRVHLSTTTEPGHTFCLIVTVVMLAVTEYSCRAHDFRDTISAALQLERQARRPET